MRKIIDTTIRNTKNETEAEFLPFLEFEYLVFGICLVFEICDLEFPVGVEFGA